MCAYEVPDPVRHSIERLLVNGVTEPAAIAGQLHRYEFAVEIQHRLGIIEQVKENYRDDNPTMQYEVADDPITDAELKAALDADH